MFGLMPGKQHTCWVVKPGEFCEITGLFNKRKLIVVLHSVLFSVLRNHAGRFMHSPNVDMEA